MCAARRRAFADLGALAGHDGRKVEPLALLRERFPALDFRDVQVVEDGWDSLVLDLDGKWIVRFPRRPEVEQSIEREIALLPELAQRLPVEVPRFELIAQNGVVCVGYRKITGSPARSDVDERTGGDLGRFLSALHGFPVDHACALGIPYFDRTAWREHFTASARTSDSAFFGCCDRASASGRKQSLRVSKHSTSFRSYSTPTLVRSTCFVATVAWSASSTGATHAGNARARQAAAPPRHELVSRPA
jgi:hypothetical protein